MPIDRYIQQQEPARAAIMHSIHQVILTYDTTVQASVGLMMGKEMIIYNDRGSFKYGLASVKEYLSLHVLPIYMNPALSAKYTALLPFAKFQKGCINFKTAEAMPLAIIEQLFTDCATIDLVAIREKYLKDKKAKK